MKPNMKISLLFDAIEGHKENFAFMARLLLKLVYEAKNEDSFHTYPEVIIATLLLLVLVLAI